jgi:hypothetical protein
VRSVVSNKNDRKERAKVRPRRDRRSRAKRKGPERPLSSRAAEAQVRARLDQLEDSATDLIADPGTTQPDLIATLARKVLAGVHAARDAADAGDWVRAAAFILEADLYDSDTIIFRVSDLVAQDLRIARRKQLAEARAKAIARRKAKSAKQLDPVRRAAHEMWKKNAKRRAAPLSAVVVAKRVIADLGLDLSVETVRKRIADLRP